MAEIEINFPQSWQLMPLILRLAEEHVWERFALIDRLCSDLRVSMAERIQLAGKGRSSRTIVDIRIGQARQDLKKEGFVAYPDDKWVSLTSKGKAFLWQNKDKTDEEMALMLCHLMGKKIKALPNRVVVTQTLSLSKPVGNLCGKGERLVEIVLDFLCAESFSVFEYLSLEIVKKMWPYPPYRSEVTQKTADGGLDGIVQFDELGHHITAFQSKRNARGNKVGSDRIQAFKGAMIDHDIRNGVFFTTSDYTSSAQEVAEKKGQIRIKLINGRGLVAQMRQKNIGLVQKEKSDLWQIDMDFFNMLRNKAI